MPLLTAQVDAIANHAAAKVSITADRGRLKAATLMQTSETSVFAAIYGTITLHAGSSDLHSTGALLASGEVTPTGPIGWTGDLPLRNDYLVTATIKGNALESCLLSILYELDK